MHKTQTASEIIKQLADELEARGEMEVGEFVSQLGDRSFSFLLIVFSLISAIPGVPGMPGFGALAGIPVALFGLQLMFGYDKLWLPQRLKKAHVHPGKMLRGLERTIPHLKKMERLLKPRWSVISVPPVRNLLGLMCCIMGGLVALPIPFTNMPLGIALAITAVGLLERDGKAIAVGMVCMAICIVVVSLMAVGMVDLLG